MKVSFQLESFSGYKPEIIKQDFYSTFLLSNLSALIKNMADTHRKSNDIGIMWNSVNNSKKAISRGDVVEWKKVFCRNILTQANSIKKALNNIFNIIYFGVSPQMGW